MFVGWTFHKSAAQTQTITSKFGPLSRGIGFKDFLIWIGLGWPKAPPNPLSVLFGVLLYGPKPGILSNFISGLFDNDFPQKGRGLEHQKWAGQDQKEHGLGDSNCHNALMLMGVWIHNTQPSSQRNLVEFNLKVLIRNQQTFPHILLKNSHSRSMYWNWNNFILLRT